MVKLIYGDRIAKDAVLRVNATAVIFDSSREKVLLIRRLDNGRWCVPGGGMDPGESAEETCARETLEETGLEVVVTKLVGIYTSPDVIATYEDGNRWQSIGISFEAEVAAGDLRLSRETTDIGYFSIDLLDKLDLLEDQLERIQDAVINSPNAIMK